VAVERLKKCDNIVALSRELDVHRRLLYKWRDQLGDKFGIEGPNEAALKLHVKLGHIRWTDPTLLESNATSSRRFDTIPRNPRSFGSKAVDV
jgi:transposase-like protein